MRVPQFAVLNISVVCVACLCGCGDGSQDASQTVPDRQVTSAGTVRNSDAPSDGATDSGAAVSEPSTSVVRAPTVAPKQSPKQSPVQSPVQSPGQPSAQAVVQPLTQAVVQEQTQAQVWRPEYRRPVISDELLRRAGLVRYSSRTVDLITDLTEDLAGPLVSLPDAALPTLAEYFGELPAAQNGSSYGINAFVMRDRELFDAAGLVPSRVPMSFHGQHIGAQFWMNDQTSDYYRRHLLIHEATHAYMRHLPGPALELPQWYLEGMAELIATHEFDADDKPRFAVMPTDRDRFPGLERIVLVQRDVAENGVRSITQITGFKPEDFVRVESYAWCWALCRFLDSHPKYRSEFRSAARRLSTVPLQQGLASLLVTQIVDVETEWTLFAASIEHGYDFERAVINFPAAPSKSSSSATIASNRGWQVTEIQVEAGRGYSVTASGRFTLADKPKPWVSEANGVSIRYVKGRPIGLLLASVLADDPGERASSMLTVVPLGNSVTFKAPFTGRLCLRVNDAFSELSDNRGSLTVTVGRGA
jgi:hypothetical protein